MSQRIIKATLFLIVFFLKLHAAPFYCVTVPKSGSHLLKKALWLLTQQKGRWVHVPQLGYFLFLDELKREFIGLPLFKQEIDRCVASREFPLGHMNCAFAYEGCLQRNWVPILQIRDLRDVCVSCAYFCGQLIEEVIGPCSFDEKLMYVITRNRDHPTKNGIFNIYRHAEEAVRWMRKEGVVVSRFEELIGNKGGGDERKQRESLVHLANAVQARLTQNRLDSIVDQLFGVSSVQEGDFITFREGQIGSWKKAFKEEHIQAFILNLNPLQNALGYDTF